MEVVGGNRMNAKYGLIVCSTENLGDDIQSLAAKQFLPRIDVYVDRDYINNINCSNEETKLIMNGWFTHRPDIWLPPPCTVSYTHLTLPTTERV